MTKNPVIVFSEWRLDTKKIKINTYSTISEIWGQEYLICSTSGRWGECFFLFCFCCCNLYLVHYASITVKCLSGFWTKCTWFLPMWPEEEPYRGRMQERSSWVSHQQNDCDREQRSQWQSLGIHHRCHPDPTSKHTHLSETRWVHQLINKWPHVPPLDQIITLASHRWFPGLHIESPSGWGLPCGLVLSDGLVLLHEWRPVSAATAGARPGWRDE